MPLTNYQERHDTDNTGENLTPVPLTNFRADPIPSIGVITPIVVAFQPGKRRSSSKSKSEKNAFYRYLWPC